MSALDHSSHDRFYEYYAQVSQSPETRQRFGSIRDMILRVISANGAAKILDVADIGCGAGTQSLIWAELGHRVHALDVNEQLLELAKKRAVKSGCDIDFRIGSAVDLPWDTGSMDVCLVPELLEHVIQWRTCLNEFSRVLRHGGVLFLTTTNKLCPMQQEFSLPFYSWYPATLKRHFERLATTTHPHLVNFAKYPAVNWFTFYSLRRVLVDLRFRCLDRFDVMDLSNKGKKARIVLHAIRKIPLLRILAQFATPSTILVAVKTQSQVHKRDHPHQHG